MEIFKLTKAEVNDLKDSSLEQMIKFNRELKVQYAAIKRGH
jgi:hypothetical protein